VTRDETEQFVLRRSDYSLSDEQQALRDAFRLFFEKQCSSERVREAEPLGWDEALWSQIGDLRPVAMGVPVERGGDGAGLVELALVAEEFGRRAAPLPLVEAMVAARLLAALDAQEESATAARERPLEGAVVSIAVGSDAGRTGRRLVPGGAVADSVVGLDGERLVVASADVPPPHVPNLASAPLAWWDLADGATLATGEPALTRFANAQQEWRVLTAAALVGVGQTALDLAAEYAKERVAFGVAIGSFQSVAHPLADVLIGIESARRLTHKAAWFLDHEADQVGPLASMAFVHAAEAAERAGSVGVHTQGGFGFTLESDEQLFYRRAKGWALIGGDRRAELQRVADRVIRSRTNRNGVSA
jgi:alkylation response protein AidB-like acyl-CoA dehydrogenase